MFKRKLPGEITLLLAAIIWGSSFVAQSLGSETVECFTYNGVRSLIGAGVLLITVALLNKARGGRPGGQEYKRLIKGGVICGCFLYAAVNAQQYAIAYVDPVLGKTLIGKVGFLTTLYMVLVPVIGIFLGRKTGLMTWISVIVALAGMWLLTGAGVGGGINASVLASLLSALMFALQIIAVDKYAPNCDCLRLSMVQFTVCGVLSMLTAFIFETPTWQAVYAGKWPLLYSGIMSSGIAYTLQMVGQKNCRPQVASIIMSLESVFCALAGLLFLGESMCVAEYIGCVLMFAAVLLTQVKTTDAKN